MLRFLPPGAPASNGPSLDERTVLLCWGQIVSVGATWVQSVLEGPAEEGRTYSGNQLQTGHSLEVYEGKCSRGQLVWNTKRKRLWQVESRAGEERECEIRDWMDFTSSASPAAWWSRLLCRGSDGQQPFATEIVVPFSSLLLLFLNLNTLIHVNDYSYKYVFTG